MKILDTVISIIERYELGSLDTFGHDNIYSYLREHPEMSNNYKSEKDDNYFLNKYKSHIPKKWYGFSIGDPIIPAWCEILDEILEICITADPEFEIHQIKIKFGGIRFYVHSDIIEDITEVESLIVITLYDHALIY